MTATESLRDLWGLWGVEKTEGGQVSMISAQCDKLRESAQTCRMLGRYEMEQTLLDSADLILELRDGLQRANAENERLRERMHELETEGSDHFYRTAYAGDASRTLEAENTRLRELFLDVADLLGKNEKLRELADRLRSAVSDGADNALDENAKLRKQLLDVWNDAMQADGFRDHAHDDGEIYDEDELPHYQERVRELGVEVEV